MLADPISECQTAGALSGLAPDSHSGGHRRPVAL